MRAWMWMFVAAWLVTSGGCSCLIDADKYRGGGGNGDGGGIDGPENLPDGTQPPDGRIESDAGPIEPTTAREGEGAGTGAPPLMIVLRGDFEPGTTARVVRSGDVTDLVAEPAVVSTDGSMLAVGIRIPVDSELAEGDTVTLEVYTDDGGGEDLIDTLIVNGLDEADLSGPVDTTMLDPIYSSITISDAATFAGASPAILRSITDITIGSDIIGNGQLGGAAGPGGCTGGAAGQQGQCNLSGGGGGAMGVVGTGGGGGGHLQTGNPGAGGGAGGEPAGNDMLTPLVSDGGNGGGGGGHNALNTGGGPGGGGGGAIEVSAGGSIGLDAVVNVSGGNGTNGGGLCTAGGGSGGGGSGGAILVRARSLTVGAGSLDASRGLGGTTCNTGGNGSPGRIRIDVASEDLPALTAQPAPVRGPHWADDTPHLVRDAELTATLYGQPNRTFAANVDGGEPEEVDTDGDGIGTYTITLEPGHNRICAIVSSDAMLSLPEAVRCQIVTYLP